MRMYIKTQAATKPLNRPIRRAMQVEPYGGPSTSRSKHRLILGEIRTSLDWENEYIDEHVEREKLYKRGRVWDFEMSTLIHPEV